MFISVGDEQSQQCQQNSITLSKIDAQWTKRELQAIKFWIFKPPSPKQSYEWKPWIWHYFKLLGWIRYSTKSPDLMLYRSVLILTNSQNLNHSNWCSIEVFLQWNSNWCPADRFVVAFNHVDLQHPIPLAGMVGMASNWSSHLINVDLALIQVIFIISLPKNDF